MPLKNVPCLLLSSNFALITLGTSPPVESLRQQQQILRVNGVGGEGISPRAAPDAPPAIE